MSERVKIKIQGKVHDFEGKLLGTDNAIEKEIILDKPMKNRDKNW